MNPKQTNHIITLVKEHVNAYQLFIVKYIYNLCKYSIAKLFSGASSNTIYQVDTEDY